MENFHVVYALVEIVHELLKILYNFEETRNFGANGLTICFLVTLLFTILSSVAFIKQAKKISDKESGESLSLIYYSFLVASAFSFMIYGLYKASLALVINGSFIGGFGFLILINLLKNQKYYFYEYLIGIVSIVVIPLMIIVQQKDFLFFLFGSVLMIAVYQQIYVIYKNKNSGNLHPGQVYISIVSTIFWLMYAWLLGRFMLLGFFGLALITWLLLLFFYFFYKKDV